MKAKKVLKTIRNILLILIGVIVLGVLVLFIVHINMLSAERKLLEDKGYINLASAGDYCLNVCVYGADEPDHTFVGLSGLGVHDYSLTLRGVTDRFSDKNRIVIMDRAGYGMSDDTTEAQTAERVVDDYRAALKSAGINAPYILLPHSLGGMYATYWVSKYPEEIEGIVYLDATEIIDDPEVFADRKNEPMDYFYHGCCNIGLQRLFYGLFEPSLFKMADESVLDIDKALTWKNFYSRALMSETDLMNRNYRFVYENIVKTDVPKVYITANGMQTIEDCREHLEQMRELMKRDGVPDTLPKEFTDEYLENWLKLSKEFLNESVYPFVESVGNCYVELLNTDHYLYISEADKCAEIIERFLGKLG